MARARQSGFTLLEVVVAFVLLALTLATVFQLISAGLARAGTLDEQAQALAIAQSRLASTGVEEAIQVGEKRGESPDRRFRWLVQTARYEDPAARGAQPPQSTYNLYRVEVTVEWDAADHRARAVRLATLMLGPRS